MALTVEVVSRERVVWTGEASYVRVRTVEGDLGISPGLIPTCALLAEDGEKYEIGRASCRERV